MGQMAENAEVQAGQEEGKHASRGMSIATWVFVAVISIGGGFATPFLINGFSNQTSAEKNSPDVADDEPPTFIEFGEVVVNLNESRLNRYLRLNISLLVDESQKAEIESLIEQKKTILKSWLLSYLADKGMEDIRGATGQNRLRREIQNHFNSVLFADGYQRIRNVLFLEFNIQ